MLVLYRRVEFLQLTANPDQTARSAGFILSHNAASQEEVDKIVSQAVAHGAARIGKPLDEEWGYSVSITDPDGHQWELLYSPDPERS